MITNCLDIERWATKQHAIIINCEFISTKKTQLSLLQLTFSVIPTVAVMRPLNFN
jgi:hypothetical protein